MQTFSAYGRVTDPIVIKPTKSQAGMGWFTVKYTSLDEANAAIVALERKGPEEEGEKNKYVHLKARLPLPLLLRTEEAGGDDTGVPVRLTLGQMRHTKVKNKFRVGVFREWMEATFGVARIREGSGVLDVAGGKGELALQLVHMSKVPATVVEPRRLQLATFHKRLARGFYHRLSNGALRNGDGGRCAIDGGGASQDKELTTGDTHTHTHTLPPPSPTHAHIFLVLAFVHVPSLKPRPRTAQRAVVTRQF